MKVLVTGSAGFIASSLLPKLRASGHEVIGVDSLISETVNHQLYTNDFEHHLFDINDTHRLSTLMEGCDLAVHLAAKGNVIESINQPLSNFHSNVTSTMSLLEAMRTSGCKRIVFASTGGALMGNTPPPVDESTLPRPISPYGASKLACEAYLSAYAESYGFSSTILRFGNVYGPYSSHKVGVINRWIRLAIEGKPLVIYGDGSSSRDYIHVDDLVNGLQLSISRLLQRPDSSLEIFHLANHKEITLQQLKNILNQCLNGGKLRVMHEPARLGEVGRNFANTNLAISTLGFNPAVDFLEGITSLYDWIKSNEY